ncbi:hypothetical protein DFH06DRAFT_1308064 [Mycena polygramma]|nr:hypothetical protein DFH06DRAFT_1308064 [Mycena polygramma]
MQDLAQEVSTKGAKGEERNVETIHERQDERLNEITTYSNITAAVPTAWAVEAVGSSRGDLVKDQRWKGSPSDSLIRRMRGSSRSISVFAHHRERAPLLVLDWHMGRWYGLERASASITTEVESSASATLQSSYFSKPEKTEKTEKPGSKPTKSVQIRD